MGEVAVLEGVLGLDEDLVAAPVLFLFWAMGEMLEAAMIHDLRELKVVECCWTKECVGDSRPA